MKPARYLWFAALAACLVGCLAASAAEPAVPETPPATSPPAESDGETGILAKAWNWFNKGGPIMYPIALTSLFGLAFVIERAAALRRKNAIPDEFRRELTRRLDALDVAGAIAACEERDCSLARVVKPALLRRSGTLQEMEKAAEDAGVRELWLMRRNIRPVGIVAQVSPLLGLLGTISGMIGAFRTMGSGDTMGNPSAFASDIHEALFTTFFGLSVAIPMLLCFHWLEGKGEALIAEIEETAADLLLRLRDRRMQNETSGLHAVEEDA